MASRLYTATLLALYQLSLLLGIALLPVAMVTERLGLSLPMARLVGGLKETYEQATG